VTNVAREEFEKSNDVRVPIELIRISIRNKTNANINILSVSIRWGTTSIETLLMIIIAIVFTVDSKNVRTRNIPENPRNFPKRYSFLLIGFEHIRYITF
jgi:hypothetical protein